MECDGECDVRHFLFYFIPGVCFLLPVLLLCGGGSFVVFLCWLVYVNEGVVGMGVFCK